DLIVILLLITRVVKYRILLRYDLFSSRIRQFINDASLGTSRRSHRLYYNNDWTAFYGWSRLLSSRFSNLYMADNHFAVFARSFHWRYFSYSDRLASSSSRV